MRSVKIGSSVVFVDQKGVRINALVIANWGQHAKGIDQESSWEEGELGPTINVCFVDQNPERTDSYGRQFKRETSVTHKSGSTAPGFWWALKEELE